MMADAPRLHMVLQQAWLAEAFLWMVRPVVKVGRRRERGGRLWTG